MMRAPTGAVADDLPIRAGQERPVAQVAATSGLVGAGEDVGPDLVDAIAEGGLVGGLLSRLLLPADRCLSSFELGLLLV
jgi:hypothetical protein